MLAWCVQKERYRWIGILPMKVPDECHLPHSSHCPPFVPNLYVLSIFCHLNIIIRENLSICLEYLDPLADYFISCVCCSWPESTDVGQVLCSVFCLLNNRIKASRRSADFFLNHRWDQKWLVFSYQILLSVT